MTVVSTPSQLRDAINKLKSQILDIPSLAQYHVTQECAYSWQWARATWTNSDDYWTGRYRGSVTIGVGQPSLFALPEHPERPDWPEHPHTPYQPIDIDELMQRVRPSDVAQTVYVSVNVPYAETVEENAHPREVAYQTAVHYPYNWQQLFQQSY